MCVCARASACARCLVFLFEHVRVVWEFGVRKVEVTQARWVRTLTCDSAIASVERVSIGSAPVFSKQAIGDAIC